MTSKIMPIDDAALHARLAEVAQLMRRRDVEMIHRAGMGHIGGDLSSIDILVTLYFEVLQVDPRRPDDPNRDRFVMSKGHASGGLYNVLAERGYFSVEETMTYLQPMSRLNGHPHATRLPGIEASTGPLGHGLPIAVGMALAAKLREATWRTFVVVGDGELQEGSNWEAAMAASHFGLDNLMLIVDRNGLQQGDTTESSMSLEPLADRLRAFGWEVHGVDGHDYGALLAVFSAASAAIGRPTCVIARTVKGRGVSFMENRIEWHHKVPSDEQLQLATSELNGTAV